ncbi:cAMP-dependent protein kinase catalytic subunit PRKX [Cyclospora cayetanensis]|uniref:cAMP-dependent protein kinase catalytic subunit PRKX n=1 Tax=Cyclospora cayetanensis TaxID=88456 RepID=A0A6P5WE07_9EIME|nr:cAMP-dependent protein kinase catalytic subunit PRKX [Cyclospora cayetanensis]
MSLTADQYPQKPPQRKSLFRSSLLSFLSQSSGERSPPVAPPASEESSFMLPAKRSLVNFGWISASASTISQPAMQTAAYSAPYPSSSQCSLSHGNSTSGGQRIKGSLGRVWGKLSSMQLMNSCRIDSLVSGSTRPSVADEAAASEAAEEVENSQNEIIQLVRKDLHGRDLKIEDFVFFGTVGTGSFGRVCIVDIKGSQSWYPAMALKILSKHKVVTMKQVEHVKDERRILSQISHPFIVNLLASFQDEKRLFLLMEYVNGGELFSYLRKQTFMPTDQARLYAAEITLAFQYLHERSIVYRDLKPENLLIDAQGHIKITDFGFAKVVTGRTWTLCGTHEYLAPESITRRGHGLQVDWWALGILLFEMLAGRPPFVDDTPLGIYKKIIAGKIEFPPLFDCAAKSLVKRLLIHEPNKRYGCLRDGAEDVKNHKFFRGIDWNLCYQRKIRPLYKPNIRGPRDSSMFDTYAESTESSAPVIDAATQQALFHNF